MAPDIRSAVGAELAHVQEAGSAAVQAEKKVGCTPAAIVHAAAEAGMTVGSEWR